MTYESTEWRAVPSAWRELGVEHRENSKGRCPLSRALRAECKFTRQIRWADPGRENICQGRELWKKMAYLCKGGCGQCVLNGLEDGGNSQKFKPGLGRNRATCPLRSPDFVVRQAASCKEFGLELGKNGNTAISIKKRFIHSFTNQIFKMQCLWYASRTDWGMGFKDV